ncbi:hypothetical protein H0H81_010431, partial [Sphagnurus paluster]
RPQTPRTPFDHGQVSVSAQPNRYAHVPVIATNAPPTAPSTMTGQAPSRCHVTSLRWASARQRPSVWLLYIVSAA